MVEVTLGVLLGVHSFPDHDSAEILMAPVGLDERLHFRSLDVTTSCSTAASREANEQLRCAAFATAGRNGRHPLVITERRVNLSSSGRILGIGGDPGPRCTDGVVVELDENHVEFSSEDHVAHVRVLDGTHRGCRNVERLARGNRFLVDGEKGLEPIYHGDVILLFTCGFLLIP